MELISPTDFAKEKVQSVQEYAMLAARSIGNLFKRPLYLADMIQQADLIGFGSLPIVVLTGFFTGGALAQNSGSTLQRFGSVTLIGQLVSLGMVRELGPVITGLMVADATLQVWPASLARWWSRSRSTPCARSEPIRCGSW